MSIVNLVSGGLDSTLIGVLAKEEGIQVYPLFIDYGQRAAQREWEACQFVHEMLELPVPTRMDLSGFGRIIWSGLTSDQRDLKIEAFTPGRNMLFLLVGSAYAFQVEASAVAIGLLSERYSLFPDQRAGFIEQMERAVKAALGRTIRIVVPLFDFSKADVLKMAIAKGIRGTYSCHAGTDPPCGECISCLEIRHNRT
jgi:7-cyano-7-deazaguanine synthase